MVFKPKSSLISQNLAPFLTSAIFTTCLQRIPNKAKLHQSPLNVFDRVFRMATFVGYFDQRHSMDYGKGAYKTDTMAFFGHSLAARYEIL